MNYQNYSANIFPILIQINHLLYDLFHCVWFRKYRNLTNKLPLNDDLFVNLNFYLTYNQLNFMTENRNVFLINIEKETLNNNYFRKVLFTSDHQQLVIMTLKPLEDIPKELHKDHDQFFRIESGQGVAIIGNDQTQEFNLTDGDVLMVPANTWHRIINTSATNPLKLYTIYSPPEHPKDRTDITKPDTGGAYKKKYQKYKQKYLHLKSNH